MFLVLGLLVFPSQVVRVIVPGVVLAAALMLVARPVAVWLCLRGRTWSTRERALVSWVGLRGAVPIILISTYRMDSKKAPHWVVMSGFDDECIYVHDPDPETYAQTAIDCQFIPLARNDFELMTSFGRTRLRTAVIVHTKAAHS